MGCKPQWRKKKKKKYTKELEEKILEVPRPPSPPPKPPSPPPPSTFRRLSIALGMGQTDSFSETPMGKVDKEPSQDNVDKPPTRPPRSPSPTQTPTKLSAFRRASMALGFAEHPDEDRARKLSTIPSVGHVVVPSDLKPELPPADVRYSIDGTEHKVSRKILVQSHRQLSVDLDELTNSTAHYHRILQDLCDVYHATEGDCPCFRYSDLRHMVEKALEAYEKPRGEDDDEKQQLMGSLHKFKDQSHALSVVEQARRQREERYTVMSEKELEHGVVLLQREHRRLSDLHDAAASKLDRLKARHYHASYYCCIRRYSKFKAMIEEATKDCLRDE